MGEGERETGAEWIGMGVLCRLLLAAAALTLPPVCVLFSFLLFSHRSLLISTMVGRIIVNIHCLRRPVFLSTDAQGTNLT